MIFKEMAQKQTYSQTKADMRTEYQNDKKKNLQMEQKRIEILVKLTLKAVAQKESSGKSSEEVTESSTNTSAGIKASYATKLQTTTDWTRTVLQRLSNAGKLNEFNDILTQLNDVEDGGFKITHQELVLANQCLIATSELWQHVQNMSSDLTFENFNKDKKHKELLEKSGLDQSDLKKILLFRQLRIDIKEGYQKVKDKSKVADEYSKDPHAISLGIKSSDIKVFLTKGYNEDQNAWLRKALEKKYPKIAEKIEKASKTIKILVTKKNGIEEVEEIPILGEYEFFRIAAEYLKNHPNASDEEIVKCIAIHHHAGPGKCLRKNVKNSSSEKIESKTEYVKYAEDVFQYFLKYKKEEMEKE